MHSVSKLLLSKYFKVFIATIILVLLSNPAWADEEDPVIKKCEACRKIEDRYRDVSIFFFKSFFLFSNNI